MSSTAQCAIQNLFGAGKERHDLVDHDRRMVGAIPPAGRRLGHLQKRFISLSTAGVNCGIAVSSCAASFGYFWPPAGRLIWAKVNASRAVRARSQLRLSLASIVALWIAPRMLSQMRAFFGKSTRIVIVILGTFLAVSCPYLIWALLKSGMQIGSWWELLLWYLAFFVTPVPFVSIVAFELASRRQLQ